MISMKDDIGNDSQPSAAKMKDRVLLYLRHSTIDSRHVAWNTHMPTMSGSPQFT